MTLHVRGPERIALVGANGAGKTTLLRTITGQLPPLTGVVRLEAPARLLPQRLDVLDATLTIVENVARFAPRASHNTIRAQLARLLFPGERADQLVATLSGGELFRATLAALLLAEPAPHLLMLDEPTNNLDLPSVRTLTHALAGYRGALLVASHDLPFLRTLGVTRWLRLDHAQLDRSNVLICRWADVFCGIDCAEEQHDVAPVNTDGRLVAKRRIIETIEGFAELTVMLAEAGDSAEDPSVLARDRCINRCRLTT